MTKHPFLRRIGARLLALTLAVALTVPAAADGEESGVTDVKLNKSSLTLLVDQSERLEAAVEQPEGAASVDVTWSSSNASIAAVEGGVVTAKRLGEATITASAGGKSASCRVTVTTPPITGLIVYGDGSSILEPGKFKQMSLVMEPTDADESTVTWHSSDTNVARVDHTGLVSAVGPGQVEIWAKAGEVVSNKVDLQVSGIRLEKTALTLKTGESYDMVYSQHGNAAMDVAGPIRWSSDRTGVAMVSGNRIIAQRPGDATITAEAGRYTATCYVTVEENKANTIERELSTGDILSFAGLRTELNANCHQAVGSALSYVANLSVPTNQGILYYGYVSMDDTGPGVGSTERYHYSDYVNGARSLSDVTFVPKLGFNGTAVISYTGYAENGNSYEGKISVKVEGGSDVAYTTTAGIPVQFQSADFSAICRQRLGRDISYVTFQQPSASRGTLYYNYSGQGQYSEKVSSDTKYNRTRNPYLDNVSFVPAEGYAGTVRVDYRCVDTAGNGFNGQMTITVSGKGGAGEADVTYSGGQGKNVTFLASDFNSACQETNGAALHYVRFTLPDSSQGTLYYNYRSDGSYDSKVSDTTRYYRSGTPSISNITFVPKRGFTGTVSIPMTGYDMDGGGFQGNVYIRYGEEGVGVIRYETQAEKAVTFAAADFNEACLAENGESLDHIQFELPSAAEGTLYYNYSSASSNKVSAKTKYYRVGTPSISKVTFVPAANYSGTVSIGFSGYDAQDGRFSGTVEIQVTAPALPTIRYTGSAAPIQLWAEDLRSACREALGRELSSVQFTSLPGAYTGCLYNGYVSPSQTGTAVNTGISYHNASYPGIEQLRFVPKAGFQGKAVFSYTGTDVKGSQFRGLIEITVGNEYCPDRFADMGAYAWAKPSVEFLYQSGVTKGITATHFGPSQNIRRGDFVLMLCRAFQLRTDSTTSFSDVPAGSHYAWAIATAKDLGIAKGNNGKFMPNNSLTRQEAMVMIKRTMLAAGHYLPDGNTAILDGYVDGAQVSAYARDAVATLVQLGVVQGNSAQKLNPRAPISRAEMAVILHRVLTL